MSFDHPTCSDCGQTSPTPFGPLAAEWLRDHDCEVT